MEKRKKVDREEEEEEEENRPAAETLWGDLLPEIQSEILSRVPYRSLCRFKCVSTACLALCSDPAVRRRSPQTLSGFFCYSQLDVGGGLRRGRLSFLNLSGWGRPVVDPSLRFVRGYVEVTPMHCCGGILLCFCLKAPMSDDGDYVICNPATQEIWAVLPVPPNEIMTRLNTARLCFDPAAPGRFVVFVFVQSFDGIQTVEAYSSDAGRWTSVRSQWNPETLLLGEDSECVFFNGILHLADARSRAKFDRECKPIRWMVTVDMEGKTWSKITMPHDISSGFIGQSRGRLYATHVQNEAGCQLSVWVLEDYASGVWTLKRTASILELLGRRPHHEPDEFYRLIAIHPECSLIFLVGGARLKERLMSYDLDSGKLHVICALGDRQPRRFQPYIPCFAEKPR